MIDTDVASRLMRGTLPASVADRLVGRRPTVTFVTVGVRPGVASSDIGLPSPRAVGSRIRSNDVRVPQPQVGEALIVERLSSEHVKAVILHPDDFAELERSSRTLDELAVASGPELTDLGARAHRLAESPEGELVEDETSVRRLLGV